MNIKGYLAIADDGLVVVVDKDGNVLGRPRGIYTGAKAMAWRVTELGPVESRPCPRCSAPREPSPQTIHPQVSAGGIRLCGRCWDCDDGRDWDWDKR